MGYAAGGIAAAAAAAQKKRAEVEEERMTPYDAQDLDGWEFKIVRSNSAYFRKPENLRKICEEEARAGWELLEKFDQSRARFKRRVENRANDRYLEQDPYRTEVGISQGLLVLGMVGIALALAGAILLFAVTIR